ncbi:Zn(II)2Cys6 transcription factor [Aspergillus affinis]|uniref:Zn(II)2Cys6 transcription factor n=1 Tax=Aspergillus affinis TaxID=1070780 RepID=UPI0022FF0467|nr:fungal-specific transcription factor domain-containing protein [Aspergillus affinis]KAI9036648.1 fungal-specific transcription factor domain-containing protein [Aspergillus affinis]
MNDFDRLSLCSSNTPTAEHLGCVLPYDGRTDRRSFQSSLGPGVSHQVAPGHTGISTGASAFIDASQPPNPKVPISKSTKRTSAIGDHASRAGRACENCHKRKYKCSGHQPTCRRCQVAGVRCVHVKDLATQVHTYEHLLQDVCSKLDPQSSQHILGVLNRHKTPKEQSAAPCPSPPSSASTETDNSRTVSRTTGTQRSLLGPLDYASEDFNRGERVQSIGFLGVHSETTWMYRLKRLMDGGGSLAPARNEGCHSVSSMAYFVDEKDSPVVADVNVSQLPPGAIGDQLVDTYFRVVHPCFPIIGQAAFWGQYQSLRTTTALPSRKWLVILNLVFAVTAKYMYHGNSSCKNRPHDSLVYFSRAWKLLISSTVLDAPDLQQVQIEGLTSFYLLSVGQINRSWRTCGVSICSAVAMGLNLRSESDAITHVSKETRYRVWWSLYTLDILLSVITGRPPSSNGDFCTTPLPLPFKEDNWSDQTVAALIADHGARTVFIQGLSKSAGESTGYIPTWHNSRSALRDLDNQREQANINRPGSLTPNNSLYFLHFIELGLIMRQSIDALYAASTVQKLWCEIEIDIHGLIHKTDAWLSKLPPAFHFTQGTRAFERQRSSLAFSFYSTKILITIPCLSRVTEEPTRMGPAGLFCDAMANLCVDLAADILDLLPDVPDMTWIHDVSPWWCILHYLMQSIAVLQVDLMLKENADTKFESGRRQISKASRWLETMSTVDPASQRACLICTEILSSLDSCAAMRQARNSL